MESKAPEKKSKKRKLQNGEDSASNAKNNTPNDTKTKGCRILKVKNKKPKKFLETKDKDAILSIIESVNKEEDKTRETKLQKEKAKQEWMMNKKLKKQTQKAEKEKRRKQLVAQLKQEKKRKEMENQPKKKDPNPNAKKVRFTQ